MKRSLLPREHGAYGQLVMPLLTGLTMGRPGAAALLIAAALVTAFLAHEPLLVVLGHRGTRAVEADGARARRLLAILGLAMVLAGGAGLALAPGPARAALACPVALGGVVGWLMVRRLEKTLPGELVVAAALSSGSVAVALAGGVAPGHAFAAWTVWVVAFATATLAVHAVLGRSRGGRAPGAAFAIASLALVAGAFAAVPLLGLPRMAAVALLPTGALSVVLCLARVPPRRLREVGWALVGSSVLTMVLLALGLR
jgi:hypothetical protein